MRRIILGLAIAGALVAGAHAQIWIMSPATQGGSRPPAPPLVGSLLLEDGSSFLLLEDASSHLCLEGGC